MNTTHSEINFIINKGAPDILFVVSPYRNRFRYSRPCSNCIKFMRFHRVKYVVYSTGDSSIPFIIENVKTMPLVYETRRDAEMKK
jgi:hypothetical protein